MNIQVEKWLTPFKQLKAAISEKLAKKQQQQQQHQKEKVASQRRFEKAAAKNPYLQSKAMWNDLYGSLQMKLQNSYRIIFILSCAIVIAMIGLVVVASETKIKPMPFIIHGNDVITVSDAQSAQYQKIKPKLALFFARKFLRDSRMVSTDGEVNARNMVAAYSMVTGAATQVLKDFYSKNNPNTIAQHFVKNIQISSILQNSPHTLDIRWHEVWRSVNTGDVIRTQNYIAQITYHYEAPSQNQSILKNNPLGFEITHLSWSHVVNS